MRYSRQILLDGWDMEAQLRLKNSRVLIVGAGGLGCALSPVLVRAGVGLVHLLDFDVVDDSNLQRQMLYEPSDVGQDKARTAASKLRQMNELVCVNHTSQKITDDNVHALFDEIAPDLVVDCTDNFTIRDTLNAACRVRQLPLLSTSAIGEVGQMMLLTKETGCYRCVFGDTKGSEQNCATSGVLASTVALIGAAASQVALDFLGRGKNPIAGELVLWQGMSVSLRKMRFNKDENCAVCGGV
ncbi:molybdopterin biosynthesis protein [Moraxella caviae]|nr:HesA/MoeB/ThiF family protein [Moraxella caviae]OOR91566.1 molybdopterin biosynthesis protein [Moraxella caviae]